MTIPLVDLWDGFAAQNTLSLTVGLHLENTELSFGGGIGLLYPSFSGLPFSVLSRTVARQGFSCPKVLLCFRAALTRRADWGLRWERLGRIGLPGSRLDGDEGG